MTQWIQDGLEQVAMVLFVTTVSAVVVLISSVFLFAMYVTAVIQTLCDDERTIRGTVKQMRTIMEGMRMSVDRLEMQLN